MDCGGSNPVFALAWPHRAAGGGRYLNQWPLVGLVEQLDDGRDAIVETHGVLGHLSLRVAAGEVAQGADGGAPRCRPCRPHAGWRG